MSGCGIAQVRLMRREAKALYCRLVLSVSLLNLFHLHRAVLVRIDIRAVVFGHVEAATEGFDTVRHRLLNLVRHASLTLFELEAVREEQILHLVEVLILLDE